MKSEFSNSWNSAKKPSKQRKFRANAPLHIKRKLLGCHLIKDLKEKFSKRSIVVRKGDKVVVMRGTHKGKEGLVESVSTKNETLNINGIDLMRKNGSKSFYPIKVNNVMIKELDLSDKKRKAILERTTATKSAGKKEN